MQIDEIYLETFAQKTPTFSINGISQILTEKQG